MQSAFLTSGWRLIRQLLEDYLGRSWPLLVGTFSKSISPS